MFTEIQAREALRVKLVRAIRERYAIETEQQREEGHDVIRETAMESLNKLAEIARDEDRNFRETVMPAYRQMLATFREKLWLAEPATRAHLAGFIEFVDIF